MKFPKPFWRKSKNAWYVQLNGKQKSLGPDKDKAFAAYRKLLQAKGIDHADDSITVHSLVDAYLEWAADNLARSTTEHREIVLGTFKRHVSAAMKAVKLKPYHVDGWIKTLNCKSPNTIHARKCLIISVYHWGRRYGYINSNPVAGMPKPTPQPRRTFVPPERFAELLQAAGSKELEEFIYVMLETGARCQEMQNFRAEHFDGSKLVLPADDAGSKCKDRVRTVYLPNASAEIVRRRCTEFPEGPIFRHPDGRPWDNTNLFTQFRRLRKATGIPLCATTLRHSFCHFQLTNGVDPLIVSKLMGHKDLKQIARTYGHLENSQFLADAAKKIKLPTNPVASTTTDESE